MPERDLQGEQGGPGPSSPSTATDQAPNEIFHIQQLWLYGNYIIILFIILFYYTLIIHIL